jgi:hypothetical protein
VQSTAREYITMSRTENGRAVLITKEGARVVALDVIARLSGIGAAPVTRVLAALQLVASYSGLTLDELAELDNVPTAAPDEQRAEGTHAFCQDVARYAFDTLKGQESALLKLDRCL